MSAEVRHDPGALLCALVLAPAMLPRNRFFSLFAERPAARARGRAKLLRSFVRQIVASNDALEIRTAHAEADGSLVVAYHLAGPRLTRTAFLDPLEASLLRFTLGRALGDRSPLPTVTGDREAVLAALARLGPDAPAVDDPCAAPPR